MSLDASRWAWQQQLKLSDKMLLLALADRAGADNTSWPSYETLQQDTGMHRNTISGAIKRLEEAGLITKTRRMKTSSLYQLIGVPDRHENTPKYTSGRNKDKGNLGSTNTVLKGSTKSVLDPVQKAYEGSSDSSTGTYQEPTNRTIKKETATAVAVDYAFEGERVKINAKDYQTLINQYPNLDITKELSQLDMELREEKKWWGAMQAKLNYRNKSESKNAAHQRPSKPKVNFNSEGSHDWRDPDNQRGPNSRPLLQSNS